MPPNNRLLAADNEQRSPIGPWYHSSVGRLYSSVDSQRCLLQPMLGLLDGGAVCRAERFSVGTAEPATGQISTPKRRLAVVRNAVANSIG